MSKLFNLLSTLVTKVNLSVKAEAQEFTEEQKVQVCHNIGAIKTPTTVKIGQIIAAKAVDENNKPTEWEAVDVYNKTEIDLILNGYIADINNLIGGDD